MQPIFPTVGIVGTGAMGRGIAQMAVQAGSQVLLFDLLPGAAEAARAALADTWQKLVVKNKLTPEMQAAYLARVSLASAVTGLAPCALVVEAIAPDGLIEAVRLDRGNPDAPDPFLLAVQWHPEWRVTENPFYLGIFQAFAAACRHRSQKRR